MSLKHLAIIMDGNRRWARANHLATLRGHHQGAETLKSVARDAHEQGVEYLTCFAFSTENWKRPQPEVTGLISLMQRFLMRDLLELTEENVQLKIIGDITVFSDELQDLIRNAEQSTRENTGLKLALAVNYGGLADITQAASQIDFSNCLSENEKIAHLKSKLFTAEMPNVDLLIRTGGEKRVSNFLMFDIAYAELYFTDTLWPDFSKADLLAALEDYNRRDRRFGANSANVVELSDTARTLK